MPKKIAIIGSTGSIGRQTLEVIDQFPEKFIVTGLAGGKNIKLLAEQVHRYHPAIVGVKNETVAGELRTVLAGIKTEVIPGPAGLVAAAAESGAELLVSALSGDIGLVPTLAAVRRGLDIALANKETLVAGGELVTAEARQRGVRLLPVDSEHSAIFQCLQNGSPVCRLILTASGGPFRKFTTTELRQVTPGQALNHPNWQMGPKITIDSATMMNKGLEVIEAHWLFGVNVDAIKVVIHPQSVIHSMVEYVDGAVLAQLGCPDMRVPIQYALTYPDRWPNDFPKLDFAKYSTLTFEEPDRQRFPCLPLAFDALNSGGTMPGVMNAANEVAVAAFLQEQIGFTAIAEVVARVMEDHRLEPANELEVILTAIGWARQRARELTGEK